MADLPRKKFLQSSGASAGPGVLTTLLRTYVEERDRESLDLFFGLLYDEHFADIALQVHSYGPASDVTVQEVIDDSLAKLLEDVVEKKYQKAPASAAEHLKYLLRRRFIDRRRYWDKKHEDVGAYRETIVDQKMPGPSEKAVARESQALADQRLEEALSSLSASDQKIVRLRLEGFQYPEIAQKLGIAPDSIWMISSRAVDRLLARLVTHAPTMALKVKELKESLAKTPEAKWPSREEIQAALPKITERVRTVIDRLHFQAVPREDLVRELGEETLGVLLRRGYDLLEARFKVSFPEALERVTS
jgi:RNA polymerase sigma factor (sigma-70 family)